jgi:hypothetical protein
MRHSLRRALPLDSVDGGTHNPTILRQHTFGAQIARKIEIIFTPPDRQSASRRRGAIYGGQQGSAAKEAGSAVDPGDGGVAGGNLTLPRIK